MQYVALLRGINVGGKNKVEMPRLKEVFKQLDLRDVHTYINSGNVLFTHDKPASDLQKTIEVAIETEFGFRVPVVVRNQAQIDSVVNFVPSDWTNDKEQKTDVLFLWDEINSPTILNKILIKSEIETVKYHQPSGSLVWSIARKNATRGSSAKLVSNEVYKHMTIRNINTVRKLHTLMNT